MYFIIYSSRLRVLIYLVLIALCSVSKLYAQEILFLEGKSPGEANIEEMTFLRGHWSGELNKYTIGSKYCPDLNYARFVDKLNG